mgnify:CR=1 FL=1
MRRIAFIMMALMIGTSLSLCSQKSNENETVILIKTDLGNMKAKLYNDTPIHRDNFIKLVKQGWYDGSPWHRVIKGFMIQGGGNADGRQDPGYTIEAEFIPGHIHKRGVLAAARRGDNVNPEKRSSGSQFYIVDGRVFTNEELDMMEKRFGVEFSEKQREVYTTVGGAPHLDGSYTVFGELIEGHEVLDKIASVETGRADRPVDEVSMQIEIVE